MGNVGIAGVGIGITDLAVIVGGTTVFLPYFLSFLRTSVHITIRKNVFHRKLVRFNNKKIIYSITKRTSFSRKCSYECLYH